MASPPRDRRALTLPLLVMVPFDLYGLGYAWARVTHRLVRYPDGQVARADRLSGLGFTLWELLYLPARFAGEKLRGPASG